MDVVHPRTHHSRQTVQRRRGCLDRMVQLRCWVEEKWLRLRIVLELELGGSFIHQKTVRMGVLPEQIIQKTIFCVF